MANDLNHQQVFEMAGEHNRGISSIIQRAECGKIEGKVGVRVLSSIIVKTTIDHVKVTVPLPGIWKKAQTDTYVFKPNKEGACEEIVLVIRR